MTPRLHAFHCGGIRGFRGFYDVMDDNPTEVVYEPAMFFLLEYDGIRVLFDTGFPRRDLSKDDGSLGVVLAENDLLPAKLAEIDLTVDDIDFVVLSHLHDDHAGGLSELTGKKVYVQRMELEFALDPPPYQQGLYSREDLSHRVEWVELDGGEDLFGDGRLTIVPTPGHTPGHQALHARLDSGSFVLCGDASYLDVKMRQRRQPGVVWNPDELVTSWTRLEALERDEGATLLFTHDLDFREKKRLAPGEFYG
jgi:N-acyl homoserine lactone hydrolase